jgi:hypothetical protein
VGVGTGKEEEGECDGNNRREGNKHKQAMLDVGIKYMDGEMDKYSTTLTYFQQ